jgi:aryl-alcohol dehydrogenase-like predicted oxidoreductase
MSNTIPGIDKPVSRLVMGVDNQVTPDHASRMFDDFLERGGNTFDTAHIYGGGVCETVFGQWLAARGVRDQTVLISKGGHTPYCTPEFLSSQFTQSLERLQTDHADVYMLHRDNLEVPVGEFVDVLNAHRDAGRMRVFGGSNWTLKRIQAANAYAAVNGLQGFTVVSNQFSLARMIEPPWAGCMAASDTDFRAWLEATQTTLLPWSSQARGFFVRADPNDVSDAELVRCWYAPDNFQRLERVRAFAAGRGIEPIHVALAFVLHQPFPTFPLIGPRTPQETESSFRALELPLTPAERAWLNLETDTVPV